MLLIAIILIAFYIGLGFVQHYIGKQKKDRKTGLIIPVSVYLIHLVLSYTAETLSIRGALLKLIVPALLYIIYDSANKKYVSNQTENAGGQ